MSQQVELTWTEFKQIVSDKSLIIDFVTKDNGDYRTYAGDASSSIVWFANVSGADKTDFENNFQSDANKANNALKVSLTDERLGTGKGNFAHISADNFLRIQPFGSPLMDEGFFNDTIDTTNKWTETIVSSATQTVVEATLKLSVTTGGTDSVKEIFNQGVRETIGSFAHYFIGVKFGTNNPTNNVKEWGYLDEAEQNGVFFRLDGGTLNIVTLLAGAETVTDINSFKPDENFHLYDIQQLGAGKVLAHIDGAEVANFVPAGQALVGNKLKRPFMRHYNTGVPASTPSDFECHWLNILDLSGARMTVVGRDNSGFLREAAVNTSRRMLISQELNVPDGATSVTRTQFSNMTGTVDDLYTITNGKTLTLQRFAGGAEVDTTAGNVISLYEDPNGDLSVLNVIAVIFASGSSQQFDIGEEFVGDGVRRILLRRRRLGGGTKELFGRWEGFENGTG